MDVDKVEISNLSRSLLFRPEDKGKYKVDVAAAMVKKINPAIKVTTIRGDVVKDIGLGVYRRFDIAIGCLDNREARLWVNRCCWKTQTPWIDGGLLELAGTVKVFKPPDNPCYECGMTKQDYQLIRQRYSCGLTKSNHADYEQLPTTTTIASLIGALQVQEALKILHNDFTMVGKALVYNGYLNDSNIVNLLYKPRCLSHEHYDEIINLNRSSGNTTILDLINEMSSHLGGKITLEFRYDLVKSQFCPKCRLRDSRVFVLQRLVTNDLLCPQCKGERLIEVTNKVTGNEKFVGLTLKQIGIPELDIIVAKKGEHSFYFELSKDAERMLPFI